MGQSFCFFGVRKISAGTINNKCKYHEILQNDFFLLFLNKANNRIIEYETLLFLNNNLNNNL